jgi:hypothetical protein
VYEFIIPYLKPFQRGRNINFAYTGQASRFSTPDVGEPVILKHTNLFGLIVRQK